LFGTLFPTATLLGGASGKHAYLLSELCIVGNLLLRVSSKEKEKKEKNTLYIFSNALATYSELLS
jgi:hypothetical protein